MPSDFVCKEYFFDAKCALSVGEYGENGGW